MVCSLNHEFMTFHFFSKQTQIKLNSYYGHIIKNGNIGTNNTIMSKDNMSDYEKAKELGCINPNRWEEGIDHHPMSERVVRFMAETDFKDHNLHVDISVGGDGDNGEVFMYLMDGFFEMLDKTNE